MKRRALQLAQAARRGIRRLPRRLAIGLAAALAGATGGAFAVASLTPDTGELSVRQILEAVQPRAAAQAQPGDALQRLYRSDSTRWDDTPAALLQRLGVSDAEAAAFIAANPAARLALLGHGGRLVSAELTERHALLRLTARWLQREEDAAFQRLIVERGADGAWQGRIEALPLNVTTRLAGGVIDSSLFAATDDERIPDSVAIQMAEIFSAQIDFQRDLRKGDRFSIVYESLEADGEPLRAGRVLSADFINDGTRYQAMWFQEPGRDGAYFTLDGESMRRAYLASPLPFTRITSGFAMRFHPILQTWRQHLGTDYGAPTGTPVRSVGDGVVEFAGSQGGYGQVVMVRHRQQHTTVYAHLSRVDVRRGDRVRQGETLGAVGATGWATGPHLHFEFRVAGVHQDPVQMARQSEAMPVSRLARARFEQAAREVRAQLASAAMFQSSTTQ